jgi:hypothetical protein
MVSEVLHRTSNMLYHSLLLAILKIRYQFLIAMNGIVYLRVNTLTKLLQ